MCGFAGVVAWDERYRVRPETLRAMGAKVAHRGPDGAAEWFNQPHEQPVTPGTPQCGLAFRRLAILDPDPRSMQPFTIGRKTMVFNGEIYNYRELRQELKSLRADYEWRTTGDTEVLLLAYDTWAEACLEKLNGMFAFAVWDDREKSLFLARDRMGQKPLYVAEGHRSFAFASEMPALAAVPWTDRRVWDEGLIRYLRYGYTDRFFEGCSQHPRSFARVVRADAGGDRGGHLSPYFDPEPDPLTGGESDVDATRRLVGQAVTRQLVSDVPLGVFLSGGVDSSVVAAAARRAGPVASFSVGFDDARYDEREHARAVASHLGTDHHEFRVHPDAAADLPRLAAVFGEPFADSSALPTHYLARETRGHVKVALSGDGGDELFGGYDRYRAIRHARALRALAPLAPLGRALARGHAKSTRARVGRALAAAAFPPARQYDAFVRLFDGRLLGQLMPGAHDVDRGEVQALFNGHLKRRRAAAPAAAATDRATYLPDDLLTKVDRASMLHGLEVRSPFMDHELVSFAAGLTTEQLLKGGPKRMLREAFADVLPAWVFKRRKMGFAVPIGEWFRTDAPLRAMLNDCLFASDAFGRTHFDMTVVRRLVDEHMTERVDHSQRLYALLMLELWWRTAR